MTLLEHLKVPPMNRQQRRAQARAERKNRAEVGRASPTAASAPTRPDRSPSPDPPADKLALLERFDGFSGLRNGLRKMAAERDRWAGIPMPLDGHRLVIEPRYPDADALSQQMGERTFGPLPEERVKVGDDVRVRNTFHSHKMRCDITIYEDGGKVKWGWTPAVHHFTMDLAVLDCSHAWGLEQEGRAVQTLGGLVRHHQMKTYLLTGMFVERSKRTGLTYCFRKLRPTVVIDTRGDPNGESKIKCCLCLHPIGFYEGSWAGAMCPTDDVIAHLMMMRGDEVMFWRRANQIPAWRPEAGL